jgi:hypothetical protein
MKKQMFTMKTLLMITLIGTSILLSSYKDAYTSNNNKLSQINKTKKKTKKNPLVGAWIKYVDSDRFLGFLLKEDGTASSINMARNQFMKWKQKGNKLFFMIAYGSIMCGKEIGKLTCKIEIINDSILKIVGIDRTQVQVFTDGEFKKDNSKTRPIVNIKNGQKITSPLNIEVNTMGIWPVYDGKIGTLRLVDENNKQLGITLVFSSDGCWDQGSPDFKAQLSFDPKKAKSGKLIFCNEQVKKGSVVQRSFEIPITF